MLAVGWLSSETCEERTQKNYVGYAQLSLSGRPEEGDYTQAANSRFGLTNDTKSALSVQWSLNSLELRLTKPNIFADLEIILSTWLQNDPKVLNILDTFKFMTPKR
jgi:hypothetical protein